MAADADCRPGSSDGVEPVTEQERRPTAGPPSGPDDVTIELPPVPMEPVEPAGAVGATPAAWPADPAVPPPDRPGRRRRDGRRRLGRRRPAATGSGRARHGRRRNAGRWGIALLVTAAILAVTSVGLVFLSTAAPPATHDRLRPAALVRLPRGPPRRPRRPAPEPEQHPLHVPRVRRHREPRLQDRRGRGPAARAGRAERGPVQSRHPPVARRLARDRRDASADGTGRHRRGRPPADLDEGPGGDAHVRPHLRRAGRPDHVLWRRRAEPDRGRRAGRARRRGRQRPARGRRGVGQVRDRHQGRLHVRRERDLPGGDRRASPATGSPSAMSTSGGWSSASSARRRSPRSPAARSRSTCCRPGCRSSSAPSRTR